MHIYIYISITFYREIINFKSLWVKFNLNYLYAKFNYLCVKIEQANKFILLS